LQGESHFGIWFHICWLIIMPIHMLTFWGYYICINLVWIFIVSISTIMFINMSRKFEYRFIRKNYFLLPNFDRFLTKSFCLKLFDCTFDRKFRYIIVFSFESFIKQLFDFVVRSLKVRPNSAFLTILCVLFLKAETRSKTKRDKMWQTKILQ